jgi:hypothetical protein
MDINFDLVLKDRKGEPMKTEEGKELTLGQICVIAIDQGLSDSRDSSLKYKMGKLANLIYKGGVVSVKSDEIAQLKDLVGKVFPPHILQQTFDILEGEYEVKDSAPSNA